MKTPESRCKVCGIVSEVMFANCARCLINKQESRKFRGLMRINSKGEEIMELYCGSCGSFVGSCSGKISHTERFADNIEEAYKLLNIESEATQSENGKRIKTNS